MGTVRVLTFPSDDALFRGHVELAQQRIGGWDAEATLARLRAAYPTAAARKASSEAVVGFEAERWYVYRDGSALAASAESTWASDPDAARTSIGSDGTYVDANEAAGELLGRPRDAIIGCLAGAFTKHESDEDLRRRLLDLAGRERIVSTAVVHRPDGTELPIEFAIRTGEGGGYEVTMRPISSAIVTAPA